MKLGLVTYNLARDWDLPTLLSHTREAGLQGVELRTQHAHGVELSLDADARRRVRRQFEEAGLTLWALGATCEFHSPDPAVVARNNDETKQWCRLAEEVGARGVKVRPNGVLAGEAPADVLRRIGQALAECGEAARSHGVEIFLEVHGAVTQEPRNIRTILDSCAHPSVGACWNSNPTDLVNDSAADAFALLAPHIRSCHINDLWSDAYPYRELFRLLRERGYAGFTLCEVGTPLAAEAGVPFLKCYRGLWSELQRP